MADVPKDITGEVAALLLGYGEFGSTEEAKRTYSRKAAEAVIALLSERERRTAQGVTVPEGWVLVPIEPTDAMMNAGLYQSGHDAEWADVYSAWRDMVSFAPSLSTSAGGGERG